MASPRVRNSLDAVANSSDKPRAYEGLFESLTTEELSTQADLIAITDAIFDNNLGVVAVRPLLVRLVRILGTLKDGDVTIAVGTHILDSLSSQTSFFEEQNAQIRFQVATAHENNEDFLAAATILAGIPLESSQRKITSEDKAKVWIRITRCYLEVDDTTSAEVYLNKFKNVSHQISNQELTVHFQLSQARIQDARRDFLAASKGYQDISLLSSLDDEERSHSLSMAIKCAVLAPAGPARSRALKRLYTDERSSTLEEFGILEKMFLNRLIAPAEVAKFAEGLAPHQLAKTGDGSTVLVKAMGEHNLLGTSRLYDNIPITELGLLLGVDEERAEETCARMIEQGRLVGRIDQINQVIYFEGGEATGQQGTGRTEGIVGRELRRWDANVQGLAEEVEKVTSQLQAQFPAFVAAHLVV